ncbi:MAG TPA: hypothetical protein VK468_02040, partial [Pyrinomonadaceae bacterium]|nr:hypothetical protein [Pyrinomonadaceae bacterium]
MFSKNSKWMRSIFAASIGIILTLAFTAAAQDDPDPNSPTPVLLSEQDSTRALAVKSTRLGRSILPQTGQQAFTLNSKITLYATNIDLMDGEGANAFRINVEDAKGRHFQFPVVGVQQMKGDDGLYAFTVLLRDDVGFWEPPTEDGDLLIALTWRGLSSNRVRLGLGKTGGMIKDDPGSAPTPRGSMPASLAKPDAKNVPTADYGAYRFSGDRKRFLEQAAFGPTVDLDQRIRRIGLRTWLAEQFEAPYPSFNNPYPDIPLMSTNTADATLGCGPPPEMSTLVYR